MNSGHSADVSIGLLIDGNWLRVAQLGPDFLILREGAEHSPCDAVIKLRVDDVERHWTVRLPEGISSGSDRVMLGFAHTDDPPNPPMYAASPSAQARTASRSLEAARG